MKLGKADLIASKKKNHKSSHVYISNLPDKVSEDELKQLFLSFGNISDVRVIKDPQSGRSKGYAFVHFEGEEAGRRAVEEGNNKLEIGGKKLVVERAKGSDRFRGNSSSSSDRPRSERDRRDMPSRREYEREVRDMNRGRDERPPSGNPPPARKHFDHYEPPKRDDRDRMRPPERMYPDDYFRRDWHGIPPYPPTFPPMDDYYRRTAYPPGPPARYVIPKETNQNSR